MKKKFICDKFYKHLSRNEIPYQTVVNKISLDSIRDELKDFPKNIKNVNFQENNILKQ